MRTYRFPAGGEARALRLLGIVVLSLAYQTPAQSQERKYLFEIGAAGAYLGFGDSLITDLKGTLGGVGRIGIWLPYNLSLEAEGSIAKPKTRSAPEGEGVSVKSGYGALLYNIPVGPRTWGYAKLGYGGTRYADPDNCVGAILCGNASSYLVGLGVRFAITPELLGRGELAIYPNKGTTDAGEVKFTNYGLNLGLSYMLGSKPLPDSDADGVPNKRDRCANTLSGAQVDGSGCPVDSDSDGVANGVDRCANTPLGATVDPRGCPSDGDGDNIADGVDRCPDTPAGVLVDSSGCPRDSDGDTIPDGLDRCSDTPRGATVDALGCPGDEDGDGTLDGLDRCPRTSAGVTVGPTGCPRGQPGRAAPADTAPQRPAQPAPAPAAPAASFATPMVLTGVSFGTGSARLQPGSYVELDSIAKVLMANPNLRVEIGGHTDNAGSPADNQHLSTLRAEAVRNYLIAKGVPFQQVVSRGYGATMPRTGDNSPQGRALNRRVEIRPLPPGT